MRAAATTAERARLTAHGFAAMLPAPFPGAVGTECEVTVAINTPTLRRRGIG